MNKKRQEQTKKPPQNINPIGIPVLLKDPIGAFEEWEYQTNLKAAKRREAQKHIRLVK
jgi:hypothetical protein